VVLSHHITRYSHTLTHIHILPHNSHHWPLCKSANVGIAARNTAERYLQEGPVRLPLWQWRSPRPTEIDAHVAYLSSGERKRHRMMRDQVSMKGVAKRWPVVLPDPLTQTATFSISAARKQLPFTTAIFSPSTPQACKCFLLTYNRSQSVTA
jgi:hypothetical protein